MKPCYAFSWILNTLIFREFLAKGLIFVGFAKQAKKWIFVTKFVILGKNPLPFMK